VFADWILSGVQDGNEREFRLSVTALQQSVAVSWYWWLALLLEVQEC